MLQAAVVLQGDIDLHYPNHRDGFNAKAQGRKATTEIALCAFAALRLCVNFYPANVTNPGTHQIPTHNSHLPNSRAHVKMLA